MDVNVENEEVASGSQIAPKVKKFSFNFPGHILWSIYFDVDKTAKTMTCKLCQPPRPSKFTGISPKTSNANNLLASKLHKEYVLANMPNGVDFNYWTDEK
jgi:hypothetical protein